MGNIYDGYLNLWMDRDLTPFEMNAADPLLTLNSDGTYYIPSDDSPARGGAALWPTENSMSIYDIPELDDDPFITLDITGRPRPDNKKDVGCYQNQGDNVGIINTPMTVSNVGPWYVIGDYPTMSPTMQPSYSTQPTVSPIPTPTDKPVTNAPSLVPTVTDKPSKMPTGKPTSVKTFPTALPTYKKSPSESPWFAAPRLAARQEDTDADAAVVVVDAAPSRSPSSKKASKVSVVVPDVPHPKDGRAQRDAAALISLKASHQQPRQERQEQELSEAGADAAAQPDARDVQTVPDKRAAGKTGSRTLRGATPPSS